MSSAKIYTPTDKNILKCSEEIRKGNIVVFPTETVYGIGASAMNAEAVQKIYRIKKRPTNNPLIMHVLNWEGAKIYTNLNEIETKIVETVTKKFWPGPLTILVKKSNYVIDEICAKSDYVAIRSSSNSTLRNLIEKSMVPIVAPSANLSGKVTSTCKDHVLRYFENSNISIITDNNPTQIGVESTIIKIDNNNIYINRPGLITRNDIAKCFEDGVIKIDEKLLSCQQNSPGSSISHYTTNKKTYMFNFSDIGVLPEQYANKLSNIKESTKQYLSNCALIDFNKINSQYYHHFGAHVDLSETGDLKEVIYNLYNVLHQLNTTSIKVILIFDFWSNKEGLFKTIFDRFYRSSEGKHLMIPINFIE
tara:strand:- start:539 stop:1627 length:1089 start_codon:yes stop_codon:yes gene_type:complete